jgi:hypothetical protein
MIWPNEFKSMFEGYFWEGKQHGLGRFTQKPFEADVGRNPIFAVWEKS